MTIQPLQVRKQTLTTPIECQAGVQWGGYSAMAVIHGAASMTRQSDSCRVANTPYLARTIQLDPTSESLSSRRAGHLHSVDWAWPGAQNISDLHTLWHENTWKRSVWGSNQDATLMFMRVGMKISYCLEWSPFVVLIVEINNSVWLYFQEIYDASEDLWSSLWDDRPWFRFSTDPFLASPLPMIR